MANNRAFLACACGETFCIAKTMDDVVWYVPHTLDSAGDLETFDAWLRRHSACPPGAGFLKKNVPPWSLTWEDCEIAEDA